MPKRSRTKGIDVVPTNDPESGNGSHAVKLVEPNGSRSRFRNSHRGSPYYLPKLTSLKKPTGPLIDYVACHGSELIPPDSPRPVRIADALCAPARLCTILRKFAVRCSWDLMESTARRMQVDNLEVAYGRGAASNNYSDTSGTPS